MEGSYCRPQEYYCNEVWRNRPHSGFIKPVPNLDIVSITTNLRSYIVTYPEYLGSVCCKIGAKVFTKDKIDPYSLLLNIVSDQTCDKDSECIFLHYMDLEHQLKMCYEVYGLKPDTVMRSANFTNA